MSFNAITIASAASIARLNVSVWEARKQDKKTAAEVTSAKGARSRKAATVSKHLFSECDTLEAIKAARSQARLWLNENTLPWDDNGGRILPTAQYMRVTDNMRTFEQQFGTLVQAFLNTYSTEISKQAFEMGALFDRAEYPAVEEVAAKFRFGFTIEPMPVSGDFRVDVGNEAMRSLKEQYDKAMEQRVSGAMFDAWQRVKEQVEWVKERMDACLKDEEEMPASAPAPGEPTPKPRRPKLYASMLDQGLELCRLLTSLNVTNDPRLEEARRALEAALSRIDIDSLRESTELQRSTQSAMQSIIDKFAF